MEYLGVYTFIYILQKNYVHNWLLEVDCFLTTGFLEADSHGFFRNRIHYKKFAQNDWTDWYPPWN